MAEPAVRLQGLRKSFSGNDVLHGIDLNLPWGELIGFMGPNGAGKSTLIKILAGVHGPDSGSITFDGAPVAHLGNRDDVGFVHQDLGLIDNLSVLDNLRLGMPPIRAVGPILNRRSEREAAEAALSRVGLEVPLNRLVGSLSPGEKALVAVARLLDLGARLIIVDEATSTLPPPDARRLMLALKAAAAAGNTILVVSHKLSEILDAADRVVVLIDGRIVADDPIAQTDRASLVARLMEVEAAEDLDHHDPTIQPGEFVLEMKGVRVTGVGPIDLVLRRNEIVGLTGLPGSGMYKIAMMAAGHQRPSSGQITAARDVRRALLPPQRERHGAFPELTSRKNLTMSSLTRFRRRGGLLNLGAEAAVTAEALWQLAVTPSDPEALMGTLSGGNQQKVLFGRAVLRRPDLYVLCEPTRGVDVGTRRELYRLIAELKRDGAAVLIVTSDAEDLFAVCDRVGAVEDGAIPHLWDVDEDTTDALTRLL